MAEGPAGHLRAQGVKTWDDLKRLCQTLNERFDAWPEHAKRNYAFPNPEDRTHRLGKPSDH